MHAAELAMAECVLLRTVSGVEVECSTTTPMERRDGSEFFAPDALGEQLFVDDHGDQHWEECVAVEPVGERLVARVHVGGRVFLAGRTPRRRIGTHNAGPAKP
jgi:hypothetical protein